MNQYFENNQNLKSEIRKIPYTYGKYEFLFCSDLGVFSKDKIDEGSKLLVETYFKNGRKNLKVLDVGAGYGFIGICVSKVMESEADMIDINKRALHLCEMNIKNNKVNAKAFESNIYENVNDNYDVIITNPPIRAGKNVYLTILNEAFNHLKESGELWFVMRTNHGVKTVIKDLKKSYNVHILAKKCGFYAICVKKG